MLPLVRLSGGRLSGPACPVVRLSAISLVGAALGHARLDGFPDAFLGVPGWTRQKDVGDTTWFALKQQSQESQNWMRHYLSIFGGDNARFDTS